MIIRRLGVTLWDRKDSEQPETPTLVNHLGTSHFENPDESTLVSNFIFKFDFSRHVLCPFINSAKLLNHKLPLPLNCAYRTPPLLPFQISFNQHGANLVALVGDFCLNSMVRPRSEYPPFIFGGACFCHLDLQFLKSYLQTLFSVIFSNSSRRTPFLKKWQALQSWIHLPLLHTSRNTP